MTENELLRSAYESRGYKSISAFIKSINSCLSGETWGRMLNLDKKIDTRTLLIMSAELSLPTAVLIFALRQRGEKIIASLISPEYVTPEEMQYVEKLRKLQNKKKIRAVMGVIEAMADDEK